MQLTEEMSDKVSSDACDGVVYMVKILAAPQISIVSFSAPPECNVFARIVEVFSPDSRDPCHDIGSVIIAWCGDTVLWPQVGERYLALFYENFHGRDTVHRYALEELAP